MTVHKRAYGRRQALWIAEMRQVESISEKYLDIWKEDNFVELYQEAREVVGEASKELIEELERQIEEWRNLYSEN